MGVSILKFLFANNDDIGFRRRLAIRRMPSSFFAGRRPTAPGHLSPYPSVCNRRRTAPPATFNLPISAPPIPPHRWQGTLRRGITAVFGVILLICYPWRLPRTMWHLWHDIMYRLYLSPSFLCTVNALPFSCGPTIWYVGSKQNIFFSVFNQITILLISFDLFLYVF